MSRHGKRNVVLGGLLAALLGGLWWWGGASSSDARSQPEAGDPVAPAGEGDPTAAPELKDPASELFASLGVRPRVGPIFVFDASFSRAPEGRHIVEYRFDFGDGSTEVTNSPRVEHAYAYEESEEQTLSFLASVTVVDDEGDTARALQTVEMHNEVGVLAQAGVTALTSSPCMLRRNREESWSCTIDVHNPNEVDVELRQLRLTFMTGKETNAASPTDGGWAAAPVTEFFPDVIAADETVRVRLKIPTDEMPEGARGAIFRVEAQAESEPVRLVIAARTLGAGRGQPGAPEYPYVPRHVPDEDS